MKIIFSLSILLIISVFSQAQDKFIKAQIIGTDNRFIENATITLLGSRIKVKTDKNGIFKIPYYKPIDSLVISSIGYNTLTLSISGISENMILKLEPLISNLEQVNISTGYQSLSKERTSGSFEKVGNKALNERVSTDIISRLEGVSNIAFDHVSTRPGITIRGMSSIESNNNPLIVIDNFPYEGDIKNINPNDVDNVTILKDASASSIWGTRAGNGVIVITTKKGKIGRPLRFDFNSNLTVIGKPDLNYIKQISSSDLVGFERTLFSNGFYTDKENSDFKPPLSKVVETLIAQRDKKITNDEALEKIRSLGAIDNRADFKKYLYCNGLNQQYALSASGSTDNISYLFSAGMDKNRNELEVGYNRFSLRAVTTIVPYKYLEINAGINYTQSIVKSGRPSFGQIAGLMPYDRLIDDNGNAMPIDMYRKGFTALARANKLLDWNYYPLEDYKSNSSQINLQSLLANLSGRYRILEGLYVDLKYQYERQNSDTRNLQGIESFYTRDLINRFTQVNSGNLQNIIPVGGIIDRTNQLILAQNIRAQINFDRSWDKHNINVIGGAELRNVNNYSNSNRVYGYDNDILSLGNVDYVNSYPTYITKNKEFIPNKSSLSEDISHYLSQYVNMAYTYNSKYTVTASARRDASNLFGVKTNEKWQPLWSAGLVWNIANEKFYKVDLIPLMRLRLTYGVSGNVDQSKSAVTTLRYTGLPADYTNFINATIIQYANPSLRWEKTGLFNAGIDFTSKNSIISGSIDYYRKKGSDLFGPAPVDVTTGIGSAFLTKNVADMQGQGLEVSLNAKILDKRLKWSAGLLFNYNNNKVTKYYQTNLTASSYISNGLIVSPIKDQPVYSIISYKWEGLDTQGNPQGLLNGQKSIDYTAIASAPLESLHYSSSATPTIFGAFNNAISWKAFRLSASISYKFNYYFRRSSVDYTELLGMNIGQGSGDFANRWIKAGDEQFTNIPSFVYPNNSNRSSFYNNSSVLVERADHIRLQYINLSYEFNGKSTFGRTRNVQIFLNASNLGIIWRKNGFDLDPDYNNNTIPPSMALSIGIRAGL